MFSIGYIFIGLGILGLIICILGLIRNEYTYKCDGRASDIIYLYIKYLLNKGEYKSNINYYKLMKLDYDIHFRKFWMFGKYSSIKPEYLEILKPYMT